MAAPPPPGAHPPPPPPNPPHNGAGYYADGIGRGFPQGHDHYYRRGAWGRRFPRGPRFLSFLLVGGAAFFFGQKVGELRAERRQLDRRLLAEAICKETSGEATPSATEDPRLTAFKKMMETDCEFCLDMREKLGLTGLMGGRAMPKGAVGQATAAPPTSASE